MIAKITLFFQLLRPLQWSKNLFVLAPLFFSYRFTDIEAWKYALLSFVCFIVTSSYIYIMNDMHDAAQDRKHKQKKFRPIASGKIGYAEASVITIILFVISILILFALPITCSVIIGIYVAFQAAYTYYLKKRAIIDVLIIASGFVLRVLMGGYAIDVPMSPWIILTTYLLALFLGFGKRYHELSVDGYADARHSLKQYNKPLLDSLIGISCVSALLSYAIYAVETARLLGKTELVYTVIFVIFGLFRYLQVLYFDKEGGEPEKILLRDKTFFMNGLIWFSTVMCILLR